MPEQPTEKCRRKRSARDVALSKGSVPLTMLALCHASMARSAESTASGCCWSAIQSAR